MVSYKAFVIGTNLRKKMTGPNFQDIKMTIKNTSKSLLSMSSEIKIDNTANAVRSISNCSSIMIFEKK